MLSHKRRFWTTLAARRTAFRERRSEVVVETVDVGHAAR